jgi:hypothetical protein
MYFPIFFANRTIVAFALILILDNFYIQIWLIIVSQFCVSGPYVNIIYRWWCTWFCSDLLKKSQKISLKSLTKLVYYWAHVSYSHFRKWTITRCRNLSMDGFSVEYWYSTLWWTLSREWVKVLCNWKRPFKRNALIVAERKVELKIWKPKLRKATGTNFRKVNSIL